MEKISTDTFSFERIRQNGFVYVDKTAILKLLADGSLGSQFFIKPLLGHLGEPDVCEIRDALKEFYSVIKTCEGLQRFAFITGVSKFSKVSIFSDLNNLNEFSLARRSTPRCATSPTAASKWWRSRRIPARFELPLPCPCQPPS